MRLVRPLAAPSALLVLLALAACSAPAGTPRATLTAACSSTPPLPSSYALDPFYAKYCMADGVPVIASEVVPDAALQQARALVAAMLANVPQAAVDAITSARVRVGVIGVDQVTTDMPEHSDLYQAFPGTDWDTRTRGVSATPQRPLTSTGEENLLCYPSDPYQGENILVHEFGHTVADMGVAPTDPTFQDRLDAAYQDAMSANLWQGTYAAENAGEYWAEGVQSYFDANQSADASHNGIDTRAELQGYDPTLYGLIDEVFGGARLPPLCP